MKKYIVNSFIKPYSATYRSLYILQKHRLFLFFITILFITSYPAVNYFYLQHKIKQLGQQENILKQKISQQNKLLSSLKQHFQTTQKTQTEFTQINQNIQNIFDKYKIRTEQWQWSLEQDNQLFLTFSQPSHILLNSLYELNKIPNLHSQEISFNKLNQDRLVQFNATFLLVK